MKISLIRPFRPLALFLAAAVMTAGAAAFPAAVHADTADPYGQYSITDTAAGQLYMNNIDGYSITLPQGASVDMSKAALRTTFTYGGVKIDVYREHSGSAYKQESYINYSNSFTAKHPGITITGSGTTWLDGCKTTYNTWTRPVLSKIEGDRNNYACFDLRRGTTDVYTIYCTYDNSVSYESSVLPVVSSFHLEPITTGTAEPHFGTSRGPELSDSAAEAYERIFGKDAHLSWGLYDVRYQYAPDSVKVLENDIGYEFNIHLIYQNIGRDLAGESLYSMLTRIFDEKNIPELTLQTVAQDNGLMVYDILNGDYDWFFDQYAQDVAAYGKPVLFRFCNEMNGDWCTYSAFWYARDVDLYNELYKYVFEKFRAAGADNAIWVWNPNHQSFPDYKWNSEYLYYPGDAYVNVIGLTAYNTGTYYPAEKWTSFTDLYRNYYNRAAAHYDQPFMITEFACSAVGGDKAAWITDMFNHLPEYPRIKAAVWWNGADYDLTKASKPEARPYYLSSLNGSVQAFRLGLATYAGAVGDLTGLTEYDPTEAGRGNAVQNTSGTWNRDSKQLNSKPVMLTSEEDN